MADVTISCLCGTFESRAGLTDAIPIKSHLCHRSQCRYNLGALSHSVLSLQDRPDDLDKLQTYIPPDGYVTRFFCSTCGSHIFEKVGEVWYVQSGVVTEVHSEQVLGMLEQVIGHVGVPETRDGGISRCFDAQGSNELELQEEPSVQPARSVDGDEPERVLQAECVCGGVEFRISRPDSKSPGYSSPWSDLIVPYHTQTSDNPQDVKWWIRGDKWLAGTCACRSCRLGLGSPIQAWAFVSKSNLMNRDGSELRYGFGTMKTYSSSSSVEREFCGRCGATIFWHDEERPGVVDLSVGLLRAPEGALAESWLSWWTKRVSFAEHAFDKHLIKQLESNLSRLDRTKESPANLTDQIRIL